MNKAPEPTQCNRNSPEASLAERVSILRGSQSVESVPVVIVGAGPTGLAAGNLLGMAGIATLIIGDHSRTGAKRLLGTNDSHLPFE